MRGVGVPHLIVRTSWVYGARGGDFLRATLERGRRGRAAARDQRPARRADVVPMVAEATALALAQTGAGVSAGGRRLSAKKGRETPPQ